MDLGLLLLRLALGFTLVAHGGQKLFGWFDGPGPAGAAPTMEKLGFRPGARHAALAGATELAGGGLLILGFLTPLGAAMVLGTMLVAAVSAHGSKGFFASKGGYEYVFILAMISTALAFTGPGHLAFDALLPIKTTGVLFGVLTLVLGLGGAVVMLSSRELEDELPTPTTKPKVNASTRPARIEGGRHTDVARTAREAVR